MNETLQTIRNRYSCRSFTGEAIAQEKVEAIALAGIQAPSAMNQQPWKVVVIKDKSLIDEMDAATMDFFSKQEDKSAYDRMMGRGGKVFYNAPVMYVVVKKDNADLDCGIVVENMALAASSLGFGNVICGLAGMVFATEKGQEFKEKIIPEGYEFAVSLLVGEPARDAVAPHEADVAKIMYI